MALLPSTHDNNLRKLRGIAKTCRRYADGTRSAQIQLSPSSELTYTITTTSSSYISQESGNGEILDTSVDEVSRVWGLVNNNMSRELRAMSVVGNDVELSQATGSVTGEQSGWIAGNRSVQLGGTVNNGAGVFGVSAVIVSAYEGLEADTHAVSTTYAVGDFVVPATPNDHWYVAAAITTGTSAGSAPTFPVNGGTVVDGGVTWRDMGLIEYVAGADYELDATYAQLQIPTTGAIAVAAARIPASIRASGQTFRLSVDYTRSAKTVNQIATDSTTGSYEVEFWFYTQNSKGVNQVWYAPLCDMTPNGDLALKSQAEYASVSFTITAKKPPAGESLYINDVPQP